METAEHLDTETQLAPKNTNTISEVEGLNKSKPKPDIKIGNLNKEIPKQGLQNKIKSTQISTSLSSSQVIGLNKKKNLPSLLLGKMDPKERIKSVPAVASK